MVGTDVPTTGPAAFTNTKRLRLDELHLLQAAKRAKQEDETVEDVFERNGVNTQDVADDLQEKYRIGKYHPSVVDTSLITREEHEQLRTKANEALKVRNQRIAELEAKLKEVEST